MRLSLIKMDKSTKSLRETADELTPIDNLYDENERLRAENEQWRTDWFNMQAENERLGNRLRLVEGERDECSEGAMELRAEIERLKAAAVEIGIAHVTAQTENERLRAALARLCDESEHVIHQGARVCACGQAVLA
jgi:hypothetical protein